MTAVAPPRVLGRLRERAARLAELVATPLVPADYVDLLDPLRSGAALRGRVVEVRPETADAVTLVIRPGRGWQGHLPGQYLRIGVDVDGVRLWRSYSLTSPADRPDGCVSVTVKLQPGGKVSEQLVRRARPGLVVQLDQAAGDFVLPDHPLDKALFVTAGSGITPVIGMLRSAGAALRDVVVVHSAPTADDVIFADELRQLAAIGRVRLVERHTRLDGHVKPDQLADLCRTWPSGRPGRAARRHAGRARGALERARPARAAAHRALLRPRARHGRGWQRHLRPVGRHRGRSRRHRPARRRRGGRGPHAVGMPDGHLLRLRGPAAHRRRARPARRRRHDRRRGRRRQHPDLHQRGRPVPASSTCDRPPPLPDPKESS
jgi:ferredoxin-NADP reductase